MKKRIAYYSLVSALILNVALFSFGADRLYTLDMVHHNPGETQTRSAFLRPDYLKGKGYDAKVFFLFDAAQFGVDWSDFDSSVFPAESKERGWVDSHSVTIDSLYTAAKQEGLGVYCMLDMLVLPKGLVEKYSSQLLNEDGKIDISRPFTQKCVRHLMRSMFKRFPQLDGLIIRTGETYLQDAPYHVGNHPVVAGMDDHVTLLNILREEVCERLDKNLIYRTWDMGNLHSLPKYYLGVTEKVKPHDRLYFSIKHTITDFWRMGAGEETPDYDAMETYWIGESGRYGVPFNPCLGIGSHKQIVEVQCQREYEGKGAHPNYIANGVIEGFSELRDSKGIYSLKQLNEQSDLLRGVWTWSRGGGWGGPYINNEFWIDLNASVMARWGNNPSKTEEECFSEVVAEMGLPAEQIPAFRRLCLLSADGVLKGQYSQYGGLYVNWTRDDSMSGDAAMQGNIDDLLRSGKGCLYIKEKDEAVKIWDEIADLSKQISFPDRELNEFIRVSCEYGRLKYGILSAGWKMMLKKREAELLGKEIDKEETAKLIEEYDSLWTSWKDLSAYNRSCSTLYKADIDFFGHQIGLNRTAEELRKKL